MSTSLGEVIAKESHMVAAGAGREAEDSDSFQKAGKSVKAWEQIDVYPRYTGCAVLPLVPGVDFRAATVRLCSVTYKITGHLAAVTTAVEREDLARDRVSP
jgi:hypothetical protein